MKKLPLHDWHETHGAKMGDFAGYTMPLYYSRPIEEHQKVRSAAGVFDITHMGQFEARGAGTEEFLQYALSNDVRAMADGDALYSPICAEDGGVLDDLIVYRHDSAGFRIIVNAGNREKDFTWLSRLAGRFGVALRDLSAGACLFAVQGPRAFEQLEPHFRNPPGGLGYYRFAETEGFGAPVFVARTGYTGEPGCEIAVETRHAQQVWGELTETLGIPPIGLAARDTLRLEACMALYGHELREEWNPLESGVGWAVKLEVEEDFAGKAALKAVKAAGPTHRLVGLEVTGRGIARADYPVSDGKARVGLVTSGALTPTTGRALALARVAVSSAKLGTPLFVEIRGKLVEAVVVARPFYKNPALRA